jgi:aryl-alcohol dehydrogenase-like predicted oxidoreductase
MTIPHVKLKHTDLVVSRVCFGTMTLRVVRRFTWIIHEPAAGEQMASEAGESA